MRDGCAAQRDLNQVLLCVLNALADRIRNFTGLTQTEAYDAIAVADNNQCCELHDTTALYGLGYAVNGNHLFCKFESLRINFSQSNTSLV